MTRLFACPQGFMLANDPDDAREVCVAAGRIQCVVDLPDDHIQDITDQAMHDAFAPSLTPLIGSDKRGLVFPDPHGWTLIPLSTACPWLHKDATELVECPRCHAPAGFPCEASEEHPIYEGTAHRVRVRVLVHENPDALKHPLTMD